jgi:hypothetical protein
MFPDLDDLLGPESSVNEMAKTPVKKSNVNDLLGAPKRAKKPSAASRYAPLPVPKEKVEGGLFALREEKGRNVGRTCINPDCKAPLTHSGRGRPPIQCGRKACFRFYRNSYRKDYDAVRG